MTTHRGAIVGAGNVAVNGHMPGWGDTIVAGVEDNPKQKAFVAARFPHIKWFDSVDDVQGVDFVDICTPPATHAPLIAAALRKGLHVLCEKPLVTNAADLVAMRNAPRVVYTVDNWRNAPILAAATEQIRNGAIGEVRRMTWTVLRTQPSVTVGSNWRLDPEKSGGGIAVDHGWHAVYVLHEWVGVAPTAVRAKLEPAATIEHTATIELDYPHASAEIFLTWQAQERRNRATIEGTRGAIHIDGDTLDVNGVETKFAESLTAGSHHADWFGGVIDRFFGEIDTPAVRGRNFEVAVICANVLAAARQAEEICT